MLTPTGRLTPSFTPAPRPQTHARALLFGLWGLHSMARHFSLCYNHSILFVTLWHQFLLPPWLKNAEHAGAGQRGFSRIALARADDFGVLRKQLQNRRDDDNKHANQHYLSWGKEEMGECVILIWWMGNQEADLSVKSDSLFMRRSEAPLLSFYWKPRSALDCACLCTCMRRQIALTHHDAVTHRSATLPLPALVVVSLINTRCQ